MGSRTGDCASGRSHVARLRASQGRTDSTGRCSHDATTSCFKRFTICTIYSKKPRYPSRFLKEIDKNYIRVDGEISPEIWDLAKLYINEINREIAEPEEWDKEDGPLQPGDTVTHKIFGKGTILEYVEERDSYTIDFNGATRTIRADFFK